MKKILLTSAIVVTIFVSCKKENSSLQLASVNVINAIVGTPTLKVNYFGSLITWAAYTGADGSVNYAANKIYSISNAVTGYPFTIVPSADTLNPAFAGAINIQPGSNYSLYIIGQAPVYDAVFTQETNIAYGYADSSVAIRFINLSPNSPAVNITLAATPTVNETTGLNYKQQTEFKKYALAATIVTGTVTFQVRDALTNALLTSYTLPATAVSPYTTVSTTLSRFKSITLAIKGLHGTTSGTNAYGVFPIANY